MADPKYKLPDDVINEPGVSDATYQDFVAPMLMGLGVGKAALTEGPAIARGLTSTAGRTAMAAAPLVRRAATAVQEAIPNFNTMEERLAYWADKAQSIGDFSRMNLYKFLKTALEQSQMSPEEVISAIQKIHADSNPIVQGLTKGSL